MNKTELMQGISDIVDNQQADPKAINSLVHFYRLSLSEFNRTDKEKLMELAANIWDCTSKDIVLKNRKREAVYARRFFWKRVRNDYQLMSLSDIGRYTGGFDHSSVLQGIRGIDDLIDFDKEICAKWEQYNQQIAELFD